MTEFVQSRPALNRVMTEFRNNFREPRVQINCVCADKKLHDVLTIHSLNALSHC
jgi:hypothetical protein